VGPNFGHSVLVGVFGQIRRNVELQQRMEVAARDAEEREAALRREVSVFLFF